MSQEILFALDQPGLRRTRRDHRREVARLKETHGIFTHYSKHGGDWLAMSMPQCLEALKGYSLTDLERGDGVVLLAQYGRLLDEAGLISEHHKTEREAVLAAIRQAQEFQKGLAAPNASDEPRPLGAVGSGRLFDGPATDSK